MRGTESKGTAYFHRLMLNPSCLVAAKNVKFLGSCLIVLQALIGLNALNASINLKGLRSDRVDVVTHNSFVTKAAHIIDCIETNGIGPGCRIDIRLGRWNMPGMPTNPAFAQIQSANWVDPNDPSQGVRVVNVDGSISVLSAQDFSNSFHMDSTSGTYQLLGSSSGQDYALTNNNTDLLSGYGRSRNSGRDSENSDSWQSGSSEVSSIERTPRYLDEDEIALADQKANILAAKKAALVAKRFGKEAAMGTATVADAPPSSSNRAPASLEGSGGGGTSTDTPDSLHNSQLNVKTSESPKVAKAEPSVKAPAPAPTKAKATTPPAAPAPTTTAAAPAPQVTAPAPAPTPTPTPKAAEPKASAAVGTRENPSLADPFATVNDSTIMRNNLKQTLGAKGISAPESFNSLSDISSVIQSGQISFADIASATNVDDICSDYEHRLGKIINISNGSVFFLDDYLPNIRSYQDKCVALSQELLELSKAISIRANNGATNFEPIKPMQECLSNSSSLKTKNIQLKRDKDADVARVMGMHINPNNFACDVLGITPQRFQNEGNVHGTLANN